MRSCLSVAWWLFLACLIAIPLSTNATNGSFVCMLSNVNVIYVTIDLANLVPFLSIGRQYLYFFITLICASAPTLLLIIFTQMIWITEIIVPLQSSPTKTKQLNQLMCNPIEKFLQFRNILLKHVKVGVFCWHGTYYTNIYLRRIY